ncbi:hypothetical protein KWL06_013990 [Clostridioides difficile]|uniref:lipoprotein n=1 Tax=Clostridioides difficile TaxID=1496 RepID=UPI00038CA858|nr:lipoprotein [Clostridioides difficile]QGZ13359.1 hypothetical protein phiCDKH01_60 [Clostridium phage phiCDKH01]EGT3796303.1 hypothetical protein [Clostridioides difficile]EGT3952669.1 hypothetical protein [Clostridioides difficile]EGT4025363.1 hypothetical protein [Clostridioides difficile]EGT4086354.1 hypothetical protein [Clostridioides difficile]
MKLTKKVLVLSIIACFSVMMFVTGCTSSPASKMEEVGQEVPKEEEEEVSTEDKVDLNKFNPDELLDYQMNEFKKSWKTLQGIEKSAKEGEITSDNLKTGADLYEARFRDLCEEGEEYRKSHDLTDVQKKAFGELRTITTSASTYCTGLLGNDDELLNTSKELMNQSLERYHNLYNSK